MLTTLYAVLFSTLVIAICIGQCCLHSWGPHCMYESYRFWDSLPHCLKIAKCLLPVLFKSSQIKSLFTTEWPEDHLSCRRFTKYTKWAKTENTNSRFYVY